MLAICCSQDMAALLMATRASNADGRMRLSGADAAMPVHDILSTATWNLQPAETRWLRPQYRLNFRHPVSDGEDASFQSQLQLVLGWSG